MREFLAKFDEWEQRCKESGLSYPKWVVDLETRVISAAPVDVLPAVRGAVGDECDVVLDGGVQRGAGRRGRLGSTTHGSPRPRPPPRVSPHPRAQARTS